MPDRDGPARQDVRPPRAQRAPRAAGPVRVVHVGFLDPGGRTADALLDDWPTLHRVAAAAVRAGVDVTVLQRAHQDATLERGGVRVVLRAEPGPAAATAAAARLHLPPLRLLRAVRRLQPDLVHVRGLVFPIETRALARALRGAAVVAQDNATVAPAGWRRRVHGWGFRALDAALFTTREQAEPLILAGVLPASLPIHEVLESSSDFTPGDRDAARASTGIDGEPALVWIGNLDANKDPLTVLDAVARASEHLPRVRLAFVFREAPLRSAVERRIRSDERLQGRVRLLGPLTHAAVEPMLRAADFLVSGTHREGSGYAVIEAFACGTTPIVTDIPSLRRITGGGSAGGLAPVGDAARMAALIVEWAGREPTARRAAARAHFERALSFDVIGRDLAHAYATVLRRP